MDGIAFKVRKASKFINNSIYLAFGLNTEDKKEVLGMLSGKNESASFLLGVLTDLKIRSIEDILITATDNSNGFTQIIKNIFPAPRACSNWRSNFKPKSAQAAKCFLEDFANK